MKRTMEDLQGDLADIVRATAAIPDSWQFVHPSTNDSTIKFPSDPAEDFGDPFTFLGDPLLHTLDPPIQPPGFFYNVKAAASDQETGIFSGGDREAKRPANLFSRMLHISSNNNNNINNNNNNNVKVPAVFDSAVVGSPRVSKGHPPPLTPTTPTMLLSNSNINMISQSSSKGCLVESPGAGLQISSPRNTGIKRRKSQAKKVVCIPAPAPANSKSSGEIVPSDLWAWRKYGQKPIKGSPYPRGYYRCSSSKGCSARKQVERSRTDPNMLVITYTSEHNHPWPTQRNALAGSTRSQPSKTSTTLSKNPTPSDDSQKLDNDPTKQEGKTEISNPDPNSGGSSSVKLEEMDHDFDNNINQLEMDDAYFEEVGFSAGPYKPDPNNNNMNQSEDSFFADLGEIEPDPLDLLFTQGFCGGPDEDGRGSFGGFYDWATNEDATITSGSTATTPATSYGGPE